MKKYVVVKIKQEVDKDFHKGDCFSCPFAKGYDNYEDDFDGYTCMFDDFSSKCPIEIVNKKE